MKRSVIDLDTLNIFCDASIQKDVFSLYKETVGCPGYICMTYDDNGYPVILDEGFRILRHSTNNEAEITAILMGVEKAVQMRHQFKTINLFSDSRICIQSLRNWIFNWVNNRDKDGIMYGSGGNYVANQQIISKVVTTISINNLNINLWHQKGHVNTRLQSHIDNAKKLFMSENNVSGVSDEFIMKISYFNNKIDQDTKIHLSNMIPTLQPQRKVDMKYPIRYSLDKNIMYNYRNMINV